MNQPDQTTRGDAQVVVDAARMGAKVQTLPVGAFHVVTTPDGIREFDLTGDTWREYPARKTGTVAVADVDSFAHYYAKHAYDSAEVYADRGKRTITAVLDAHGGDPDVVHWQAHRLVYTAAYSSAWQAWTAWDDKPMPQDTFAEFIEDNRADIFNPPAADMLEVASTLAGTSKATWSFGANLGNGTRRLQWVEETQGVAGKAGDLAIPTEMVLRLPVFDRAPVADEVTARFRYRLNGGKLALLYKLDRPVDVITAAFEGVVEDVAGKTGATVLRGTPVAGA